MRIDPAATVRAVTHNLQVVSDRRKDLAGQIDVVGHVNDGVVDALQIGRGKYGKN